MKCGRKLLALVLVLGALIGLLSMQTLAQTQSSNVYAQQVSLGDDLTMNFLVNIAEGNKDGIMSISVAGEEVSSHNVADMTPNSDGYYEFSVELAAAQMTDTVNLTLTDGEDVFTKDYSIQSYAHVLLEEDEYSDTVKAMAKAMLNYGAKAQTYFGYNVSNLADAGYELDNAYDLSDVEAPATTAEGTVDGLAFYGASLVFRSKVAVRYYFSAPNGVSDFTFAVGDNTYDAVEKDGLYYVEIPGVTPDCYGDTVTMTAGTADSSLTVSYSPLSYIARMYNKTEDDNLKALLQAMYGYHLAAKNYAEDSTVELPYAPVFQSLWSDDYFIGSSNVSLGTLFETNDDITAKAEITVAFENADGTSTEEVLENPTAWESYSLQFSGEGEATVTVNGTALTLTVENTTIDTPYQHDYPVFDVKFENVEDYLYRVGNANTVALGSLFTTDSEITETSVITVDIEALDGADVSGTYTAASAVANWATGTLQFTGTGPVKVTINGTNLMLEVVDAKNVTSAASATTNNVVLLNDVSFSTIEVSNGYTLYGNGFTMTAPSDVLYYAMNVGFVHLNNGTLDNVQIICPNFSHSIIYTSNITESANEHSHGTGDYYGNVRSAVMIDGNSTIKNSYIHGGRAALFVRSGNIVVDNSTISGGAAANIHAISAKSLTLRDVTLIQEPLQATVHDTSVTKMGLSGLFECDENGVSTPLILEGTLIQKAWIDESDSQYISSSLSDVVSAALSKTAYLHDLDGDGTAESLNLGFTYIPQSVGGTITPDVTDNRTDKATVPYDTVEVSASFASAKVHSYKNTNGTSSDFILNEDDSYAANEQGVIAPVIGFNDTGDARVFTTAYDETYGWTSTLTVDLDAGDYDFNFANLVATKYGKGLSYSVATADGTAVDTSQAISLTASGVTTYVLNVTDNLIYNASGVLSGETATHTCYFILVATKTSIPGPEVTNTTGGTPLLVVKAQNSDWSCAIPALEGIAIKYYTSATESVELDLATLTPTSTGKQNGTNNYWEYSNGYSLKVTCGYIHDTKQVYGMPVVVDNGGNKMYFTISSTNGYVSTNTASRSVTLTYDFTDPNGSTLTFSKTWQFNYADYSSGTQYLYSAFVEGNLTDASSSSSCVAPDTLITLADGTQVRVDSLTGSEELLVWNLETGSFDNAPIMFVDSESEAECEVIKLQFSDGTEVKVIGEHGFWDYDLNRYVYLDANAAQYIGHTYAKQSGDELVKVTLENVVIETELTTAWSPVTVGHLCYFVNDMLSMPGGVGGLFNIFEVDPETMTYDYAAIERDIATYGLYTYEEMNAIAPLSREMFEAAGGQYLKISIGKGNLTEEELIAMIQRYSKYI